MENPYSVGVPTWVQRCSEARRGAAVQCPCAVQFHPLRHAKSNIAAAKGVPLRLSHSAVSVGVSVWKGNTSQIQLQGLSDSN